MTTFKIDFGAGFDVTESPADKFNIELDLSELSDAGDLDGDKLDIDFTPSNYTPDASPPEADDVDDLAAHLKGIDTALASAGGPTLVRKTADEVVNNSTTLQDDDHLSLSVAANEVWAFRLVLFYNSGSTPDIELGWTVPSGTTMKWASLSLSGNATESESTTETFSGYGAGAIGVAEGIIAVGGTPGTVQLQWAQRIANASDTTLYANSYLIAWKLA